MTIHGDGLQTRSFWYANDLIKSFIHLMAVDASVTGPVKLRNPDEFTLLGLAQEVIAKSGPKLKIIHMPLPTDDSKQRQPNNLVKKIF